MESNHGQLLADHRPRTTDHELRSTDHGQSKNLVICAVGDRSVHRTWLAGPVAPNFDLFLIYFGNGPGTFSADAKYYVRNKGFKWEHLHFAAEQYGDTLRHYQNIWCPDDDIACDTASVNLLFEIFHRYKLQLAQPAISAGQFAFKSLVQKPGNLLRYSPYIEVMCPIFSREAFFRVQDTFLENRSGWGLDWLWPRRFGPKEIAIIDKVGVHHTGSLGLGENYKKLAQLGIDPNRDFKETVDRHGGINWRIHRRLVRGRVRMKRIKDPDDRRSLRQQLQDYFQWRRLQRTSF
jgi:hypothetical protein